MKRYSVPRLAFINKLDRMGASPMKVVTDLRNKLGLKCAAVQLPIGLESQFTGVVDIIERRAIYYEGGGGETVVTGDVPEGMVAEMEEKRETLIETLYEVDDQLTEIGLEREPTPQEIKEAIRRATIALKFAPVFMGSAYKNKGVQTLLDGVVAYLPNPLEAKSVALDLHDNEKEVQLNCDHSKPFVGLAFKLEENKYGQLTYMRLYQGVLARGDTIENMSTSKKVKVPRLVRMHSDEMEEISQVGAGEICAMFGVECSSGTTFTDGTIKYSLTSMYVPEPVISLAIWTKTKTDDKHLSKALTRFQREDPTFRVHLNPETNQTVISGMGELHLEIYIERLKREYGVEVGFGAPLVSYRETVARKATFDYLHKKQTGGAGQYAKVTGYVEPLDEFDMEEASNQGKKVVFVNQVVGGTIPPQFMAAVEKGVIEAGEEGPLVGHPIQGIRVVVNDGGWHAVDSSDLAFRIAAKNAVREGMLKASPLVLEPIMKVDLQVPQEFQTTIAASLNRRKGLVLSAEKLQEFVTIHAEMPLSAMMGYATDLRSMTEGKGEFSMEFCRYAPVSRDAQEKLILQHRKEREAGNK